MKKLTALVEREKCDIESDKIKDASVNKTINLIKKMQNCKPFISVSILFLCVSIILIRIMIYFYLKSKNNVLLY